MVTGGYGQFAFLCTGSFLRCRKNDFSEIYGAGMMLHIMRYYFASFMRFEIIKKKEHRFERCFSLERCFFVLHRRAGDTSSKPDQAYHGGTYLLIADEHEVSNYTEAFFWMRLDILDDMHKRKPIEL